MFRREKRYRRGKIFGRGTGLSRKTISAAGRRLAAGAVVMAAVVLGGCRREGAAAPADGRRGDLAALKERVCDLVSEAPGTFGVAFVSDSDTVLVNNGVRYAMMSVFKLHEALAVADALERSGRGFDSVLRISDSELDRDTWSPMLKVYGGADFDIAVGELVRFAIVSSDNNASNLLFSHVVSPAETDRFVRLFAADTTFSIRYSEAEMKRDHDLSYLNYSSPLAAASLIRQVFESEIVSAVHQDAVREALAEVTTGADRLGAPFAGKEGVLFAHKTGSGFRNTRGELMAFNDVAYVRFPDGRSYALAVMTRDFLGSEAEAAAVMARVSEAVYGYMAGESER